MTFIQPALCCWLNFKLLAMEENIRVLKEPFQVEHLLNNDVYWCFGYTREYLYVKKVKSTSKHYKVFKLYSVYAVLDKYLKKKIMKSINWYKTNNKPIKLSEYYDHYNIMKNIFRKYRKYKEWVKQHNEKVQKVQRICNCNSNEYEQEDVGF